MLYLNDFVSVAHFLESRGMVEDALEVATDPNYRFDLSIQLGKLEIAKACVFYHLRKYYNILAMISFFFIMNVHTILQEIATEVQSETKWKHLGELAMSSGMVAFLSVIF